MVGRMGGWMVPGETFVGPSQRLLNPEVLDESLLMDEQNIISFRPET